MQQKEFAKRQKEFIDEIREKNNKGLLFILIGIVKHKNKVNTNINVKELHWQYQFVFNELLKRLNK